MSGIPNVFDGVIIGGGHNGLVTAAYLAASGLKIGVFETLDTVGGAMCTRSSSLGTFHNLHAVHLKFHLGPIYQDLHLRELGVRLIFPKVKIASLYHDGTALVVYSHLAATCESIARLSKPDAVVFERESRTWQDWNRRFVIPEIYNSPEPPSIREARLNEESGGREYLAVSKMTPRDYVTALFKDPRVSSIVLWAFMAQGYMPDYPGISPVAFFTALSALTEPMAICSGGSAEIPKALKQFIVQHGGSVFEDRAVISIVTTGNAATGVVLSDMEEVTATHFVASAVNTHTTFFKLLGESKIPQPLANSLRGIEFDEWTLFGVHLALAEPPRHLAARDLPDVDLALKYLIQGDPEEALYGDALLRQGLLRNTPQLGAGCLSRHDPALAPPGLHSAYLWEAVPFRLANGGLQRWAEIREERMDTCLEHWRRYAPNVNDQNIMTKFAYSPVEIASDMPNLVLGGLNVGGRITPNQSGYLRPTPELSHYRTPIARLYMCGASCHPGGGATGAPGYNAANVIAEDLGTTIWWRPFRLY